IRRPNRGAVSRSACGHTRDCIPRGEAVQDESRDDPVRISAGSTVRPDERVPASPSLRRGDPVRREARRRVYGRDPRRGAPVASEPCANPPGPTGDDIELVVAGLRAVERPIVVPAETDPGRVPAAPAAVAACPLPTAPPRE